MTTNQIEYAKLLENRRNNLVLSDLTEKRDANTFLLGQLNLDETRRANQAREQYNIDYLNEVGRANRTREEQNERGLREQERANLAKELYNLQYLGEVSRSNLANEEERHRSNVRNEQLTADRLSSEDWYRRQQVSLGSRNIALGYSQLEEQRRSNTAREAEAYRSNLAREVEQNRANTVRERLSAAEYLQNKRYQEGQLDELTRSNKAREAENLRSNQRREELTQQSNYIDMWRQGVSTFNSIVDAYDTVYDNTMGSLRPAMTSILGGFFK